MRNVTVVRLAAAIVLLPAATGCVRTVAGVVTAPVRLAGKAVGGTVDMMTTSEKEKDEKYVRQMRKRDEAEAKAQREREKECRKHPERCEG
ncbi:hypothetical protein [uncultured Sphingomonas sp.]|jgi:anaerobic C4-dicarboxylate transporter|uniref:hypothetical protein n=1 Tax=uncultured Sphingomonas sp. TaxID=158754 RepID=UPI002582EC5E|nr:hypothetical protein [uncultured Sphingomonas sp.]